MSEAGFFAVGVYHPKTEQNIGTLWRTAYQLGAAFIFTIGRRYQQQASDTCKTWRHVPLFHYQSVADFDAHRPFDAPLIGIEMGGRALGNFCHPRQGIYLLGAEDHGLPSEVMLRCQYIVSLGAVRMPSFNVAVAGSIVLYHRYEQRREEGR